MFTMSIRFVARYNDCMDRQPYRLIQTNWHPGHFADGWLDAATYTDILIARKLYDEQEARRRMAAEINETLRAGNTPPA